MPDPFRYRLPNPPSLFVGREEEEHALKPLLQGGLAVVCGPAGMGKSALVHHLLKDRICYRIQCESDSFIGLGTRLADLFEESAIPAHRGPRAILELAEQQTVTVVLEDFHTLDTKVAGAWLLLLSSYARRSAWVVVQRARPRSPSVQDRVVAVGPLQKPAAQELADRCQAKGDIETLLEAAGGSPLRIRQLSVAGHAPPSDVLAGLSDEAIRRLACLALTQEPPSTLDPLDSNSAPVQNESGTSKGQIAAVEPPENTPDPVPRLERFRRLLRQRDIEAATALLAESGHPLEQSLDAGIWEIVADDHDPALEALKLSIALGVGSRRSLLWLSDRPTPKPAAQRLVWAEGLIRSGNSRRAVEVLQREGSLASNAHLLLLGEALCASGMPDQSAAVLVSLKSTSAIERAQRDMLLAEALFHAGQSARAESTLRAAVRTLRELPGARARTLLGQSDGLRLQLGLRNPKRSDAPEVHLDVRGSIFQGVRVATLGGLRRSAELLQSLRTRVELASGPRVLADIAQGLLRVTSGGYDGLAALSRNMVREAELLGNVTLYQWAFTFERVVNLSRALESPEPPWAPSMPHPSGIPGRYLQAVRVCHLLRRGEPVHPAQIPQPKAGDGPLVVCICDIVAAQVYLMNGEAERAVFLATQVTERLRSLRYFFFEGEAQLILCYALLELRRAAELETGLDELDRIAKSLHSKRYAVLSGLLRCALDDAPNATQLLGVARSEDSSPTAARAAQCLLGGSLPLDALDTLIAAGIQSRWTHHVEVHQPQYGAGWVFDGNARKVYLPGEAPRTASPLAIRILDCLFEAGHNGVPLADVARSAWGIEDFHQLRDSKRVHVAVRRLRTLIEDVPSSPKRLLTVGGQYKLAYDEAPGRIRFDAARCP